MTKAEIANLGRLSLRDAILEMRDKGYSFKAIADKLGLDESSIRSRVKDAPPPRS